MLGYDRILRQVPQEEVMLANLSLLLDRNRTIGR